MENHKNQEEYTPQEFFDYVKGKKHTATDKILLEIYDNCLSLIEKYSTTGQHKGLKKLIFHLECIEKEREIVALGIDTFIYRDDIEEFIDSIEKDAVKLIELENYEREIPDDIVDVIRNVKGKFDKLYVLFTDYTGKEERKIQKERRDKDPILFGTFQDEQSRSVVDRFYFLGDWEDEYCDLTLDKLVNKVQARRKKNIAHTIKTPKDVEELKKQLALLEEEKRSFRFTGQMKKQPFYKRVLTAVKVIKGYET